MFFGSSTNGISFITLVEEKIPFLMSDISCHFFFLSTILLIISSTYDCSVTLRPENSGSHFFLVSIHPKLKYALQRLSGIFSVFVIVIILGILKLEDVS